MLGGGLLPGTLTVVMGATGIGKSQLGLSFAHQGKQDEQEAGILFDMTSRGDSQNHRDYAKRLFNWDLKSKSLQERVDLTTVWDRESSRRDYMHIFETSGRRVTASDLDSDQWRQVEVRTGKEARSSDRILLWQLHPRRAALRHRWSRTNHQGFRFDSI